MTPLDDHLATPALPPVRYGLGWWEDRRVRYNVILLSMMLIMVFLLRRGAVNYGLVGVVWWSVVFWTAANAFYTLGWALPQVLWYQRGSRGRRPQLGPLAYNLGVVVSLLTTSAVYQWWLLPYARQFPG